MAYLSTNVPRSQLPATLLVIDHEPERINAISILFAERTRSVEVLAAEDGDEARRILATARVDAVLVDHDEARRDGIEVLRSMRSLRPDVPTAILADADTEFLVRAVNEGGASRVFVRPLDEEKLLVGMMDLLKLRRGSYNRIPPTVGG